MPLFTFLVPGFKKIDVSFLLCASVTAGGEIRVRMVGGAGGLDNPWDINISPVYAHYPWNRSLPSPSFSPSLHYLKLRAGSLSREENGHVNLIEIPSGEGFEGRTL